MKVLIIGGTGVISTGITPNLLWRGHDVTIFNRGKRETEFRGDFKTLVGDRHDESTFAQQIADAGPFDCVIDMICFTPKEAEASIKAFAGHTTQVIFCSTVDVYTKPAANYPIREDSERQPRQSFPYAYDKAICERLFEDAHARGDFQLTIIRPAHTYVGGVIDSLRGGAHYYDRILKGRPIVVHGDGQSLWSACHRDDVARAFVNAVGNEATYGKSYHVSGDEWMTWNQYHERVASAIDAPPPNLVHIPTDLLAERFPQDAEWCRENFQYNNIFDTSASKRDLGFRYTIPWEAGIRRAYNRVKERGEIRDCAEVPRDDLILAAWEKARVAMHP